jgi:hypothetical protein
VLSLLGHTQQGNHHDSQEYAQHNDPKKSMFPWQPSRQAFSAIFFAPARRVFGNPSWEKSLFAKTRLFWGLMAIFFGKK